MFGPFEKVTIIQRVRLSVMQIFYPRYYYDNSVKERFYMIGRDFIYMLQSPIFGMGYNSYHKFNVMTGHNGFGSSSNHYGMFYFALYLFIYALLVEKIFKKNNREKIVALFLIFSVSFDMFYAMPFTSKGTFFNLGFLMGCYLNTCPSARIILKKNKDGRKRISFEVNIPSIDTQKYNELSI